MICNISNEEYHSHPSLSASGCKRILRSMAHYLAPQESTPAMELGTAIHTAVLEPDKWHATYLLKPDGIDLRTSEGKAWKASTEGKIVLSQKDWDTCQGITSAILRHAIASKIFTDGHAEQSILVRDEDHGIDLRCRPDYVSRNLIIDLKSAVSSSPRDFARSVITYGYDVQEAFYRRVWQIETGEMPRGFVFVAAEKVAPYAVSVVMLDDDFYDRGHRLMMSALRDYARWVSDGMPQIVPAYPEFIHTLSPPNWALKDE